MNKTSKNLRHAFLFFFLLACRTAQPTLEWIALPFEGYKTFASPRTYDAPGTIYRVDSKGTKYHVMQLDVPVVPGETALPQTSATTQTTLGAIADYLGIARGSFDWARRTTVTVSLEEIHAFITYDRPVDMAVKNAVARGDLVFKDGSQYFVIRDAIAAGRVIYVVGGSDSGNFAVAMQQIATAARSTTARGSIQWSSTDNQSLVQTFASPRYILYTEDELVPTLSMVGDRVLRRRVSGERTYLRERNDNRQP